MTQIVTYSLSIYKVVTGSQKQLLSRRHNIGTQHVFPAALLTIPKKHVKTVSTAPSFGERVNEDLRYGFMRIMAAASPD